jgi:lipopolysaccharide export system permease protein
MLFSKIWERYFLREILKIFGLFLFAFFFLYALIDYSIHMQDFHKDKTVQIADIIIYYSFQFIKRSTLLIPLALLVATIKVLCKFNANREWVALQASGLNFRKLMRPFFIIAIACSAFNYLATEFLLPTTLDYLDRFYYSHFKHSTGESKKHPIQVMSLKDNSKLIFQSYDSSRGAFFDVLWLQSSNDIWRIKYLKADPNCPIGEYIDHLSRNPLGFFEKKESFNTRAFKEIKWDPNLPRKGFVPLENRSLVELFRLSFHKSVTSSYEKMEALTQFYFKSTLPLLSILVVLACAPFCVHYTRNLPVFFIYAVALFGYIAFFTLMNGAVILGENRVIQPFIAILVPFSLFSAAATWKFIKTS